MNDPSTEGDPAPAPCPRCAHRVRPGCPDCTPVDLRVRVEFGGRGAGTNDQNAEGRPAPWPAHQRLILAFADERDQARAERDQMRAAIIAFLNVFNTTTRRPQPAIDDAAATLYRTLGVTDE